MSPIDSCSPSLRRPFLFCLLLALLLAGLAGLVAAARKATAGDAARRADGGAIRLPLRGTNRVSSAGSVVAEDGRDFAGFYQELSAIDLGDNVRVSLRLKIFNYSGAQVSGATVRMPDRMRLSESHGSIADVSIADRQSVVVTGDFTVPRRERDQWRQGPPPFLMIEYRNSAGADVKRPIELSRSLVREVQ